MKKKLFSALIAGGIAAVGVGASLSTAIALYYVGADPIDMDISIQTSSDASLVIDYQAPSAEDLTFSPDSNINIPYKIRGQKDTNSTFTQPFIVGKLAVTISSSSEEFLNMINPTNIVGYTTDGYYKATYSSMTFGAVTGSNGDFSIKGTMMATSPVTEDTNSALDVNLALAKKSNVTVEDIATVSGTNYSVDIAYTNPTDDEYYNYFKSDRAYVVGIDGVWSNHSDEFMMVPNILSSYEYGIEYMWTAPRTYNNGNAVELKANRYGLKDPDAQEPVKELIWSAGAANLSTIVDAGDTVYWNGYFTNEPGDSVRIVKAAS